MDEASVRRSLLVDFEGVICANPTQGPSGVLDGDPFPGSYDGLVDLVSAGFEVAVVVTTVEPDLATEWLFRRLGLQLPVIESLPALAHVTARAVRFKSWDDTKNTVRNMRHEAELAAASENDLTTSLTKLTALLDEAKERGQPLDPVLLSKLAAALTGYLWEQEA